MVELQAWQGVDGRAGGDQDVLSLELFLAVFGLYLYLLGFDETAYTVVDGDLVLLHQTLHPAPELVDDLLAAFSGLRVVDLHLADLDPVVFAVSGVVQQMGRLDQCFGRDAAQVQARPSEMPAIPLLDEGYAHSQLAGPERRYVSTVPAADYHEVELISHPWLLSRYYHNDSNLPPPPGLSSRWQAGQKCVGLPLTFSRTTSPSHPGHGRPCFSKTRR